jgi:hypothetical protein
MGKVGYLILISLLLHILIMFFVFLVLATGSTFGQRCSAMGYTGLDHNKCVIELSQGTEDF